MEGENAVYQFDDAPYQDGIPPELAKGLGLARVEVTSMIYLILLCYFILNTNGVKTEPDSTNKGYKLKLRIKLRKKSNILQPLLEHQVTSLDLILHERFLVGITFPTIHKHALDMDQLCREVCLLHLFLW